MKLLLTVSEKAKTDPRYNIDLFEGLTAADLENGNIAVVMKRGLLMLPRADGARFQVDAEMNEFMRAEFDKAGLPFDFKMFCYCPIDIIP